MSMKTVLIFPYIFHFYDPIYLRGWENHLKLSKMSAVFSAAQSHKYFDQNKIYLLWSVVHARSNVDGFSEIREHLTKLLCTN